MTAAALASWGVTSEGELPNLLPIDQRSGDTGTGTLAIGVQFGLAALLAIGLISGDLVGERRQLAALRAQLTELQPEVQLIKGLERDLVEQGKLSRSFASAGEQTINPLEVVREITRLLDHGAWISVLTLDGPKLTITGRAEKNDDVQQLKILLGGNDMFNEVSECSQTRVSDGVWKFKICANVVADALEAGR